MKKSQITFFLFVSLLFGINIFAQTETPEKGSNAQEPVSTDVEINDKVICELSGNKCRKRKEILESIKNIKKNIVENEKPGNVGDETLRYYLHLSLGVEYFYIGEYNNALSIFNKIDRDYYTSDLTIYRGLVYLKQGKNDEALKGFDLLLKGTFSSPLAHFGLAEAYRHKRKYEEALEDYNRALEKSFRFSKAYFGRGIVYLKRGDILRQNKDKYLAEAAYKSALNDFNTVIEIDLNRTTPETYLYRSKVYEALGDNFSAEKDRIKVDELSEKP
jgi:tetratricopeptide (TPR) repeat protein